MFHVEQSLIRSQGFESGCIAPLNCHRNAVCATHQKVGHSRAAESAELCRIPNRLRSLATDPRNECRSTILEPPMSKAAGASFVLNRLGGSSSQTGSFNQTEIREAPPAPFADGQQRPKLPVLPQVPQLQRPRPTHCCRREDSQTRPARPAHVPRGTPARADQRGLTPPEEMSRSIGN